MLYEILTVCSITLTLALLVYTHMIRIQIQAQLGSTIAYCEKSREVIGKMSDILVEQEKAINALYDHIIKMEAKTEESSAPKPDVSMKDLMANITHGALDDGDLD